jgi:hypothetical protein
MGPLDVMILVELLRWHACMLKELHSGEQVEAVRSQTRGASSYVSEAQSTHMHQSPFE